MLAAQRLRLKFVHVLVVAFRLPRALAEIADAREKREETMTFHVARAAVASFVIAQAIACAHAAEPRALVDAAVAKLGGADKLAALATISITARHQHWDPQESLEPDIGTKLGGTARFTLSEDLRDGRARTDWVRNRVAPMVRTFIYTEVIAGDVGFVLGEDNIVLSKQAKETNPPLHTMSASRVIANRRELHRTSPRLMAEMLAHPDRLAALPDETIDGHAFPVVSCKSDDAV